MTMVVVGSSMTAGPCTVSPQLKLVPWKTGVILMSSNSLKKTFRVPVFLAGS